MTEAGVVFLVEPATGEEAETRELYRGVYLYTHYKGPDLKSIVARALYRAPELWGNHSYLGRVIFCEMIWHGNSDPDEFISAFIATKGYSISVKRPSEVDRNVIVVDDQNQRVWDVEPGGEKTIMTTDPERMPARVLSYDNWLRMYLPDRYREET